MKKLDDQIEELEMKLNNLKQQKLLEEKTNNGISIDSIIEKLKSMYLGKLISISNEESGHSWIKVEDIVIEEYFIDQILFIGKGVEFVPEDETVFNICNGEDDNKLETSLYYLNNSIDNIKNLKELENICNEFIKVFDNPENFKNDIKEAFIDILNNELNF